MYLGVPCIHFNRANYFVGVFWSSVVNVAYSTMSASVQMYSIPKALLKNYILTIFLSKCLKGVQALRL